MNLFKVDSDLVLIYQKHLPIRIKIDDNLVTIKSCGKRQLLSSCIFNPVLKAWSIAKAATGVGLFENFIFHKSFFPFKTREYD